MVHYPLTNITDSLHHDVYPAIDPRGALKGSCKGKSVLITGAGRGIGRATAIAFALAGASAIVLAARSQSELESVQNDILTESLSPQQKVLTKVTDVTSQASVKELFDLLEAEGVHVDVLINNAGYMEKTLRIHQGNPEEWWKTWEVNIKGTYLPTYFLLKSIFDNHTTAPYPITIICTSSIGSMITVPSVSSYQPSKTAVNRFAEFAHTEYGDKGVRVFAYHPGNVLTKLAEYGVPRELHQNIFTDTPELAGGFCVFLTAPDKYADTDVFRGKYVSCNWDVEDMVNKGKGMIAGTPEQTRWLMTRLLV